MVSPWGIGHTHGVCNKISSSGFGIWQACVAPESALNQDCQHWVDRDSRNTIRDLKPTFKPGISARS